MSGHGFEQIFVPLVADAQGRQADAAILGAAGYLDAAALVAIGAPIGQQKNAADTAALHRFLDLLEGQGHTRGHLGASGGLDHADLAFQVVTVADPLRRDGHFGPVVEGDQGEVIVGIEHLHDARGGLFHLLEPFAAHRGAAIDHQAEVQGELR